MKLVILDRDGVINHDSDKYIKSPEEWRPIAGSAEAIARLNRWDYHVVVATNQSGVARGLLDMDMLNAIHDKMLRTVAQAGGRIDAIFFCPHIDADECRCRKPQAGLFEEIGARFNTALANVPAIGDSMRDLRAAQTVGARPILVLTGKGRKTARDPDLPEGTAVFDDLAAAAVHLTES